MYTMAFCTTSRSLTINTNNTPLIAHTLEALPIALCSHPQPHSLDDHSLQNTNSEEAALVSQTQLLLSIAEIPSYSRAGLGTS